MQLPLMITDANGNILYACRSVKVGSALQLFASAAAKSNKNGIIYYEGKAIYTKESIISGKRLRFFMDGQKICECFGIEVEVLGDALFDMPNEFKNRVTVSLKSLVKVFCDTYSKMLFDDGVRMSVRGLISDQTVSVSPNGFAMSLAIMVRLCASSANVVTLTFANECGRVSIYADGTGGTPLDTKAKEVLQAMLYEASAAAGFVATETVHGGKRTFSLELSPLDISLLGFKAPLLDKYKRIVEVYLKMFL